MAVIKKDFNLNLEKSNLLREYFFSMLRKNYGGFILAESSGKFSANDDYIVTIKNYCAEDINKDQSIEWSITSSRSELLLSIELRSSRNDINEYFNQFITTALETAFSEKKKDFVIKNYFCYIDNASIDGEFWLNKNILISPYEPCEEENIPLNAERLISICQKIKTIDEQNAITIAIARSKKIISFVSFLLDIGLFKPESYFRYGRQKGNSEIIRTSPLYLSYSTLKEMPNKSVNLLSKANFSIFNLDTDYDSQKIFPKQTREIFNIVSKSDSNFKKSQSIEKCFKMYHFSRLAKNLSSSVQIAYLYNAIEALTKSFDQPIGFSDFIKRYTKNYNDEFITMIHEKLRCAHFHAGEFYLDNDYWGDEWVTNPDIHQKFHITREVQFLIREAIIRFLFEDKEQEPFMKNFKCIN